MERAFGQRSASRLLNSPPRVLSSDELERLSSLIAARIGERHETAAASEDPAPASPVRTPENVEALEVGGRLIDAAVSSKTWTDREAMELRRIMERMTAEDSLALQKRLAVAVNNKEVRLNAHMVF